MNFFTDEKFVKSVLSGNIARDVFWQELGNIYPELLVEMEQATIWIALIKSQPVAVSRLSMEDRWQNLQRAIPVYTKKQDRKQKVLKLVRWSLGVASVCLAVLLFQEVSQFGTKYATADFAERKELVLPDSSRIQLNSNSKLSYVRDWKSDKPREVWLDGEAMFEVKHTAVLNRLRQSDQFVVHVGDLALTVLGTKFNVKRRRQLTEVTLLEGSLHIEGKNGIDKLLVPGETFVYDENHKKEQQVEVANISKVSSWTKGEMDLGRNSLGNIIALLEDNYGYRVDLKDSSLLEKRLTGTIPVRNVSDILFVIKHTLNVHIQVDNKQITINTIRQNNEKQ